MKKNTKKILAIAFMAVFVISTVAVVGAGYFSGSRNNVQPAALTGTPADNYAPDQRTTFCESGGAKSSRYITEIKIPTPCTQPLGISTDPAGNIWFTESNTGNIAEFNPHTSAFQEFKNPLWQKGEKSQMWGVYYEPNGNVWFSDSQHNLIWRYDIKDKTYSKFIFPRTLNQSESFPQMLKPDGPDIVVNDFMGRKIVIFSTDQTGPDLKGTIINSPGNYNFTSDMAVDSSGKIWYTIWIYQIGGLLVNYNPQTSQFSNYTLPSGIQSPNGISVGPNGKIWVTDTSSSLFFSFDPQSHQFTKYVTSPAPVSTYGNSSGLIKTPITRPYWNQFDSQGRLWFNEQVANSLGVFDPANKSLVEYLVPSKNPKWSDCNNKTDCGVAQVLDFTVSRDKVWFSEWVENNIGVLDPTVPLPLTVSTSYSDITLHRGQNKTISVTLTPSEQLNDRVEIVTEKTANRQDLRIDPIDQKISLGKQTTVRVNLSADNFAVDGSYNVLIGARYQDVTISKMITVNIQ